MTKAKETNTGRSWQCPKCEYVVREATIKYSALTCNRTLKCKHGNGTVMKLVPEEKK